MSKLIPHFVDFDMHKAGLLLSACQDAYAKHHLGSENIGWEELSESLENALSETMGVKAFRLWMQEAAQARREGT